MLVVKKPTAILYNWYKQGTFELTSDVYFQENLEEKVSSNTYYTNMNKIITKVAKEVIIEK